METDKRYFVEGLFIIGFAVAAALFAVWLVSTGQRDDVVYRIRFAESVSGLVIGDPVKFHGVDVGTVKAIELDPDDPRLVQVDVALAQEHTGQDRYQGHAVAQGHHRRRLRRAYRR